MKQSKSSNCVKSDSKSISLEDIVLFCIDESIKITYYRGNLWDVDEKIVKNYGFEKEAAIRLYSPTFDYLACSKSSKPFIECNCSLKKIEWYATKKAKNLTKNEKREIAREIIKENESYFRAIIEKFNLNILFQ